MQKRNIILSLLVLVVGVGAFFAFYRSSLRELPTEVVWAIKNGTLQEKDERIKWLAHRYHNDEGFWLRMIHNEDDDLRRAAYLALGKFRRNIPEAFFTVYEKGNREDILTLYKAVTRMGAFRDMRFNEYAVADCGSSDNDIRKASYSFLAYVSVEDWTPEELNESAKEGPALLRWHAWWMGEKDLSRESGIIRFTEKILARYCSDDPNIRLRAKESLRILYGDEVYWLPGIEVKPDFAECQKWWDSKRAELLDKLMKSIKWDERKYKKL